MKKEEKKFENTDVSGYTEVVEHNYNFDDLYEHTFSELGLQQTKRDTLISLYVALFSFVVPFTLSLDFGGVENTLLYKGLIFIVVGIIGFIMSGIIVRYRVYKESYWLACQCISQLKNYKKENIDKKLVQGLYYRCIEKKWHGVITKDHKCRWGLFVSKNLFSAETLYFLIHSILATVITGLGFALCFYHLVGFYNIIIGIGVGLIVLIMMLSSYFRNLHKTFKVLQDGLDKSFNFAFSKAWTLHFYRD